MLILNVKSGYGADWKIWGSEMSLEVHTGPTPNGWKITIMLEELKEAGVELPEINVHTVDLSGEQYTKEYMAINPNQKLPTLVHNGRSIIESCAILQYLGETFPSGLFPTNDRRWDVIPWLYWQSANVGPVFGNKLIAKHRTNIGRLPVEPWNDIPTSIVGRKQTRWKSFT